MSPNHAMDVSETETELFDRAQQAVSQSNWIVGECAAKWTVKYGRGRTDADFGRQIGLSGDQVFQRRRVWETFADVHPNYPDLKWSHFYVALNWNDAPECLQWAQENQTTVAEMKAWRRAQNGEDLSQQDDDGFDEWAADLSTLNLSSDQAHAVRDPDDFQSGGDGTSGEPREPRESPDVAPAFARDSEVASFPGSEPYSPFRKDAGSAAPETTGDEVAVMARPKPTADVILKRMNSQLDRMNRMLTPELLAELVKQPEKNRNRFMKSLGELSEKLSDIGF